ncbi:Gfo/Idh/MocA family protein [Pseudomonas sp. LB3P81]
MILLVGAGPMAVQYAQVIKGLDKQFVVVGRSEKSAAEFEKIVGVCPSTGGLEAFLSQNQLTTIESAIVSVSVDQLESTTALLIKHGIKRILVEKPGGMTLEAIESLSGLADSRNASVYVAYNRRFLASVLKAKELIEQDGGVKSFNFELTEWSDSIAVIPKADGVKENWFFANTSHVTDLAFFLGGRPKAISTYTSGTLPWHSRSARFAGAGETEGGALFSYSGDWQAPGRWAVEILTVKRRFIFKPLEKLQVQQVNSVAIEFVEFDDELDKKYKPGLFLQVQNFLEGNETALCALDEHLTNSKLYARIAAYV